MLATTSGNYGFALVLANERATHRLAMDVAAILAPGDLVTLSGDLGAGKTTFARALIRHLAGDPGLEVPSPTFTLVQAYPLARLPVVHGDLYRVNAPEELTELGFNEAAEDAAVLLEWPDRIGDRLPADRLDIAFGLAPRLGLNARHAQITGHGGFAPRARRLETVRRFLDEVGFADAAREYIQGDASTRSYERLTAGTRRAVLMNAPRRPDGPPVRNGLAYSAIAHLAEDVKPFVAMARALKARGLSAPELYAADLADGLLIIEDLGTEPVASGNPPGPIEERYAAAVDLLVALHREPLPASLPVAPSVDHRLPPYDLDALLIEAELLVDWYIPHRGSAVSAVAKAEFATLWRAALARAAQAPATWVLRDFHSPNLMWLPDREGLARWFGSFSTLAGVVVIREPRGRLRKRIAREIERVGLWRFLDVLAFRAYYVVAQAAADRAWERRELERLRAAYPQRPDAPELIVSSPNSKEAEAFVRAQRPDLVVARCKTLLAERVFLAA